MVLTAVLLYEIRLFFRKKVGESKVKRAVFLQLQSLKDAAAGRFLDTQNIFHAALLNVRKDIISRCRPY